MTDGSDPLITPSQLAAELSRCKLVDGSWHLPGSGRNARAEFETARLPEAVFFDIDLVADRSVDLPHMLPSPEVFADAVGAMGIAADDPVVVYDSVSLFSAPRVWWTFRAMGHRDVRVLEGGLPRWRAAGLPISAGPAPFLSATNPAPVPNSSAASSRSRPSWTAATPRCSTRGQRRASAARRPSLAPACASATCLAR
jgi:thiosulfate/3-mercaptopyruvate sulfurtransferase